MSGALKPIKKQASDGSQIGLTISEAAKIIRSFDMGIGYARRGDTVLFFKGPYPIPLILNADGQWKDAWTPYQFSYDELIASDWAIGNRIPLAEI